MKLKPDFRLQELHILQSKTSNLANPYNILSVKTNSLFIHFSEIQCARMKKNKTKKERHTPQPLHWGNVNGHLPGIARLVSGIVCILCGKLAIQSANRMSLLP